MEHRPHRLRAIAALVAGLAALAVVAVVGMIFGESSIDASPEAIEFAAFVVPVVLVAGIIGFIVGWLWHFWFPSARASAELERCSLALATAQARVAELEATGAGSAQDLDELVEPAPVSDAPDTAATPELTPAPEPDAEPERTLTMDDVPEIDIDQETAAAQVTERFASTMGAAADDLKMIKGVGPVLERLLNDMNVRTFEQVASFTGQDIAVVSAALEAFPDRIVRDNWVGQAKDLHKATHG